MSDDLVSAESIPKKEIKRYKVSSAEIIVRKIKKKPYFEIKYFDLADDEIHIGFGSYNLNIVFGYLDEYFEIISNRKNPEKSYPADDLISRKAFLKYMHDNFEQTPQVVVFRGIISEQPTAFDKEKVIEELKQISKALLMAENFNGAACIDKAIEVIEKGGIE